MRAGLFLPGPVLIVLGWWGSDSVIPGDWQWYPFTLLFPMVEEKPVNKIETDDDYSSGTETILFVDDEQAITDITQKVLERLGYRVEARLIPVEALDFFQSKPDTFDLVITDMTIPQMTGTKLAQKLKELQPDVPVINR